MNEQKMIDLVNRIADNDKVAPFQNGFVVLTNEEMVKFAELIVKECIDKGSVLANHYIDTHTEQEQVMLLAAVSDYSREIKKHFGVKE